MSSTSAPAVAGAHPMNKKLGFLAMLLSATGMGMVGFFGRMSTPTHVVDGQTVSTCSVTSSPSDG
jgi:hypothetical protein